MAAVKALQQWCRLQCQGYRDVSISNMTTSFRDGLAFCALIHRHRPQLIDFDSLRKEDVYENNKLAFTVAEEQLGIPALLDPEDMVALRVPDRLSILTYVSQYYNYFHGRSPIGGMGGLKRPAEEPVEEGSGKVNPPVSSRVFGSPGAARESADARSSDGQRPPLVPKQARRAGQDALPEKSVQTGTLSNKCAACDKHVHLVQRHLLDRKLYHRSCVKSLTPSNGGALLRDLPSASAPAEVTPPVHPATHHRARLAGRVDGSSSAVSPPPPLPHAAAGQTAAATVTIHNIAPRTATEPTPAPRTSATVAKTLQSKLRFFESDHGEKTATSSGATHRGAAPPAAATPAPAPAAPAPAAPTAAATPAAFPPSKPADRSHSSNQPELHRVALSPSPADTSQTAGRLRVRLRADPSLLAGLHPGPASRTGPREPSPVPGVASRTGPREPSPVPRAAQPGTTAPGTSAPESETPAGWRSRLKPTPREAKPAVPWPLPPHRPAVSVTSAAPPGPSVPPTRPAPKGDAHLRSVRLGGQEGEVENGTEPESKVSKLRVGYIQEEELLRELQEIEENLDHWEKRGVELEVRLRTCEEEGEEEGLMDELMVEWFNLIRNKQVAMRRESELVYIGRSQDLEQQQPSVEQELRRLMERPEHLKTARQRRREEELMAKLVEIVNDRNAIVEGLDQDRIREGEEDEQLNAMMKNFNIKKDKSKKKSPVSKLFWWGSKKDE